MWFLLITAALAEPPSDPVPPVPPPDRARLNSYHSDPLFLPHLDVSLLGGMDDQGEVSGLAAVELRLGHTFAFGVGVTPRLLEIGPTLTWDWRVFSLQHVWCLDIELRTPILDVSALQFGIGGDISPVRDGRFSLRVRGLAGTGGFAAELGGVLRAF